MIAFPTTEVLLPDGSNLVIEQPQPAEKAARTVLDIQQSAMRSAYVGLPSCTVSGEERQITDADVLETYSSANPDEVADTKGVLVSEWHSEKCRRPTILLGKRYVSGQEVAVGMGFLTVGSITCLDPAQLEAESYGVFLRDIHVKPEYQRKQQSRQPLLVGAAMLSVMVRFARELHQEDPTRIDEKVMIGVLDGNPIADWYQSLGLIPTGHSKRVRWSDNPSSINALVNERASTLNNLHQTLKDRYQSALPGLF